MHGSHNIVDGQMIEVVVEDSFGAYRVTRGNNTEIQPYATADEFEHITSTRAACLGPTGTLDWKKVCCYG